MSSLISSTIGANANQQVADIQSQQQAYATNKNAEVAQKGIVEQAREADIRNAQFNAGLLGHETEYNTAQDTANEQLANAAAGINEATGAAPAELMALKGDIENRNTRALSDTAKQVNANLATQGVRGGQAAILANRAIGEQGLSAEENIDQLLAQNAAARQAAKAGYATTMGAGAMSKIGAGAM